MRGSCSIFLQPEEKQGTSREDPAHPSHEWLMGVPCLAPLQELRTSALTLIKCLKIGEMNLSWRVKWAANWSEPAEIHISFSLQPEMIFRGLKGLVKSTGQYLGEWMCSGNLYSPMNRSKMSWVQGQNAYSVFRKCFSCGKGLNQTRTKSIAITWNHEFFSDD